MKHPETLLIPILMLADYFLTVAGAVLRDRGYTEHFKSPNYELNPLFQKTIKAKRWYSPKHLLLTVLFTGLIGCLAEFAELPDFLLQGLYGYVFVVFGAIIGKHLSNILLFNYINRHPEEMSGQTTMAHSMSLSVSMYQYLGVAIPVGILAAFSRSPYVVGGFLGSLMLMWKHAMWLAKHKNQLASTKSTAEPAEPT